MRRTFWFGLQSCGDYGVYLSLVVQGLATPTGLNFPHPVQSLRLEALAPERRSMAVNVQLIGDFQVLFVVGSH